MSAWLCGNLTLSCCVDVIKKYMLGAYYEKTEEELIDILADLNTQSLNCRYGERMGNILENREYIKLDVSDAQKYKSVRCYLYQTCECKETVEHPLFKALHHFTEEYLMEFDKEWDNCHWDIDNPIPRRV